MHDYIVETINLTLSLIAVESDGDYFEVMPDGTVRLKAGKKKIDINKLTDDDLRRLGIDPRNMTKEEIARKLKVSISQAVFSHVF